MAQARYIVGIDLGTTNSALAYVDLGDPAEEPPLRLFPIPQLVGENRMGERPGLPSFLYLPGPHDLGQGASALPWDPDRDYIVGAFARTRGTEVPARLINSAKSWLCHGGVDRTSAILPWGSSSDVPHLAPVEVSARYLQHLREAWDTKMATRPEWSLARSDIVLTVPASFDAVARELTVEAARQAGLERITLLEEPQAAFYSWVRSQGEFWRDQLSDGDHVLVFDVGGGTSDFSLIAVVGEGEAMSLERVAVGDHLLLGGDNMDIALARHLERRLVKRAGELDAKQWAALVHACRDAKEKLLSASAPEKVPITLAGRGSKVIGGSLRIDLHRDEVVDLILDGFFAHTPFEATSRPHRTGLHELGLPYAQDPAVTRNLAAFLKRHSARPQAVLFNGGAMSAGLVQDRVVEIVEGWFESELEVLESRSLDLAVALGAATYGLVRAGRGIRIRGGTARAYYVGIQDSSKGAKQSVCLIPFGAEEGAEFALGEQRFELVTDKPVSFPLYYSNLPLGHDPGHLTPLPDDALVELPALHTVVSGVDEGGGKVTVKLGARLNEIGTLNLFCQAATADQASSSEGRRWDLEFSLEQRDAGDSDVLSVKVGDQSLSLTDSTAQQAATALTRFGDLSPEAIRSLPKELEELIGAPRLDWPASLIRELWLPLWRQAAQRKRSANHESTWLHLAGLFLRPGYGDPLDSGRIGDLWTVYREGLCHSDELWCRLGFWITWRRVAGGLNRAQQLELTNKLTPTLMSGASLKATRSVSATKGKGTKGKGGKRGKKAGSSQDQGPGINRQELAEMWRAVASLENIPAQSKGGLGDIALRHALAGRGAFAFWALGRIGARVPLYGPVEEVIEASKVGIWLRRLLSHDWSRATGVELAASQLARACGDETRDISQELREALLAKMSVSDCPEALIMRVKEVTVLDDEDQAQLFGDSLPVGLRLVS